LLNARSLVNKLNEFHILIYSGTSLLYFITETWLTSDISTGMLDPLSKFTVIRNDRRSVNQGGGVAALVSRKFNIVVVDLDNEFDDLEIICLDAVCHRNRIRVFVVYRPPYYNRTAQLYVDKIIQCLTKNISDRYLFIIVGDFNCPKILNRNCFFRKFRFSVVD